MKWLRRILDRQAHHFEKGGRLEKLHTLYEAPDTILFTPGKVTGRASHVRDGLDLKRMMMIVVIALVPCVLMAMYNTGLQANVAIAGGETPLPGWRTDLYQALGGAYDPKDVLACFIHGALYFIPVLVVTFAAGGTMEVLFAIVRKHEINEGFLVTGFLFPLILPPAIPLWQVALGVVFGVVIGKEVFGGTGKNFLNPALTARAFLFFAYPAQISGNVWVAAESVDAVTGASWLADLAGSARAVTDLTWWDAFIGLTSGSMGETSALFCAAGAVVLIVTRIGSWRTMAGVVAGTVLISVLLNALGSETNPMMNVPWYWHMVLGGWAFGTVFMATDPVSSAFTDKGKLVYGFCIGVLAILIRCVNPAYPEGMMLAILFMNLFAPLIDHLVVQANVKRRLARYGRGT